MSDKSQSMTSVPFRLPPRLFESKLVLKCIDCHAAGEPARVVLAGTPIPPNCVSALAKRAYMMEHMDHLRKILLLEPRGYPCQNANFVFQCSDGKIQYVIAEQNQIYPLMSGHNTICVATALLETGVVPMLEPVTRFSIEAPAGPIEIAAKCVHGKAQSIVLKNAPAFVEHLDVTVNVPGGIGPVKCDIAYGGMWYCVVNLNENSRLFPNGLDPNNAAQICREGEMIKVACREQYPVQHPTINYPGCDILAFRQPSKEGNPSEAKNAVVMSNNKLDWDRPETWTAMLDRSPCGTGTCAVLAVLHARGEIGVGEPFLHESIIGSKFIGTILGETEVAGKTAIVPQIEGSACVTQYSEVVVDPDDPFPEGFRVADIW